jgi:adenylylsulfate kinase
MTSSYEGFTLWLTGLSGAGKTTIAIELEQRLKARAILIERLDGDIVREGLTRDLGFTKEDRDKNIERVTFVAKLLSRNHVGVLASFISPYRAMRNHVRQETTNFIEVFVHAPLDTCIERDVKGLYAKAIENKIPLFTGISDPYEEPQDAEITVNTHLETLDESVNKIVAYLEARGFVPSAQTKGANS